MIAIFLLWLVTALFLQVAVTFAEPPRPSPWRTAAALVLQHVAISTQGAWVAAVAAQIVPSAALPWTCGALWATGAALLALDAWLYLNFGLRLQLTYIHFLGDLRLFDRRWAVHGAAALTFTLSAAAAAGEALRFGSLTAIPGLAFWSVAVILSFALARLAWRQLPASATYRWNNRLFAMQLTATLRRAHNRRSAPCSTAVPKLLVPQNEEAVPLNPRFPLLRQTQRFIGPSHFDLGLRASDRPHVVLLFIESFSGRDVGVLGSPHGVTPCFDAWAQRGILWRNFYSNGTTTSRAALASLYGLPPRFSELPAQEFNPPHCVGLPDLFNKRGYRSSYFHNGPSRFENKNPFFFNHGYVSLHDRAALSKIYPGAQGGEWGVHDEYLMRFHNAWLAARDAENIPTFSTLFTVSNHYPFEVPDDAPTLPDDLHPNRMYQRYLRSMRYSDACLGAYLEGLQASGLAEKTIVFVLADTGQAYQDDGGQGLTYSGQLTAAASRIPLLLLAPGRIERPQVIDEMASQVDLMPTIMDLFGMHETHHGVGSSLRRVNSSRRPYLIHAHEPQFMALQTPPWNYTYSFDHDVQALHNVEVDPREVCDMASSYPARAAAWRDEVLAMRAFCDHLYDTDSFAPADLTTPYDLPRVPLDANKQLPADYPRTLADMQARIAALGAQQTPSVDCIRERRFLQICWVSGLNDDDKILAAQLQYKQTHIETMGILTADENAQRLRLMNLMETTTRVAMPKAR